MRAISARECKPDQCTRNRVTVNPRVWLRNELSGGPKHLRERLLLTVEQGKTEPYPGYASKIYPEWGLVSRRTSPPPVFECG